MSSLLRGSSISKYLYEGGLATSARQIRRALWFEGLVVPALRALFLCTLQENDLPNTSKRACVARDSFYNHKKRAPFPRNLTIRVFSNVTRTLPVLRTLSGL